MLVYQRVIQCNPAESVIPPFSDKPIFTETRWWFNWFHYRLKSGEGCWSRRIGCYSHLQSGTLLLIGSEKMRFNSTCYDIPSESWVKFQMFGDKSLSPRAYVFPNAITNPVERWRDETSTVSWEMVGDIHDWFSLPCSYHPWMYWMICKIQIYKIHIILCVYIYIIHIYIYIHILYYILHLLLLHWSQASTVSRVATSEKKNSMYIVR